MSQEQDMSRALLDRIADRQARVGVIGLGYVGLPLARASAAAGFVTTGFDIDGEKIEALNAGRSYIDAVTSEALQALLQAERFRATADFAELEGCDVIVICVPTPLSRHRDPDLSFVVSTAEAIASRLRSGQLVVLESTTYPGTTRQILRPILERGGLRSGVDFFLGFSPEREDPGNQSFRTTTIPKIVSGDGEAATEAITAFYEAVVERVVRVSSPDVAEAVKITENVFRAVNIALANELKVIYDAMGIDVWEVIDAAATKPFGYMPFYPGPGLGGHCIPIDPFYLTWKAREFGLSTRFIELAGEINVDMPRYVIRRLERALDETQSLSLGAARVLIVGLSYKKNVKDIRESPSLSLMTLLAERRAHFAYHDPHVTVVPVTREHRAFAGKDSVPLTPENLAGYDAVILATDHDDLDYEMIARHARLVIDTRNAFSRKGIAGGNIVKG